MVLFLSEIKCSPASLLITDSLITDYFFVVAHGPKRGEFRVSLNQGKKGKSP